MARDARDFAIGLIAQRRMEGVGLREGERQDDTEDFLVLTPGIGLDVAGDGLGQYRSTPEVAVLGCGWDVIIVGRGIYGNPGNMDIGISVRFRGRRKGTGKQGGMRLNSKNVY